MKLVMMSCQYVVIYKCIVSSPPYKEKWFPWEFTNGDVVRGLTQYVLLCMV